MKKIRVEDILPLKRNKNTVVAKMHSTGNYIIMYGCSMDPDGNYKYKRIFESENIREAYISFLDYIEQAKDMDTQESLSAFEDWLISQGYEPYTGERRKIVAT